MLKKLVLSLLSVILFVIAACAADHGAAELPALSEESPLAVVCTGSGVLLRAEPDKNSRKISLLAKNETVYAIGVKNSGEGFPWVCAITQKGYKGWFYGQFASFSDKSLSESATFGAQFGSTVFYDTDVRVLQQRLDDQGRKEPLTKEEENGYGEYKYVFNCGLGTIIIEDSSDGPSIPCIHEAYIRRSGYRAAGLRVGDSADKLRAFNKNMKSIGWDADLSEGDYRWYLYWTDKETVKEFGKYRAKHGFGVRCSGGKITEIWWCTYLLD